MERSKSDAGPDNAEHRGEADRPIHRPGDRRSDPGGERVKDFFASIRDNVGGRSAAYEEELRRAKDLAVDEMIEQARARGANAVIGVDLDYETISTSSGGNMLMVSVSGTGVVDED